MPEVEQQAGATPLPLRQALRALAMIDKLTGAPDDVPRVQSVVLRRRAGRIRELADEIESRLDELGRMAGQGLLDSDYRTVARCADCRKRAGWGRSQVDGRALCAKCRRIESGEAGSA